MWRTQDISGPGNFHSSFTTELPFLFSLSFSLFESFLTLELMVWIEIVITVGDVHHMRDFVTST
jgi:hypothetical protein